MAKCSQNISCGQCGVSKRVVYSHILDQESIPVRSVPSAGEVGCEYQGSVCSRRSHNTLTNCMLGHTPPVTQAPVKIRWSHYPLANCMLGYSPVNRLNDSAWRAL